MTDTPDSTSARAPDKDSVCGYCHHLMSQHGAGSGCLAYQCDCPTVSLAAPATPPSDETPRLTPFHRSASCQGETCTLCGKPAAMKLGEEIMHDDPNPYRHPYTAYVCLECGNRILCPYLPRAPLVDTGPQGPSFDHSRQTQRVWLPGIGGCVCKHCRLLPDVAPPSPEGTGTPPGDRDSARDDLGFDLAGELPGVGETTEMSEVRGILAGYELATDWAEVERVSALLVEFDGETGFTCISDHVADVLTRFAALRLRAEAAERQLAQLTKPTVLEVLPLVQAYYAMPGNGAGGNLHIVLDDENVDDDSVAHCLARATEVGDQPGMELASLLLRMSRTQRAKLARCNHFPATLSSQRTL